MRYNLLQKRDLITANSIVSTPATTASIAASDEQIGYLFGKKMQILEFSKVGFVFPFKKKKQCICVMYV